MGGPVLFFAMAYKTVLGGKMNQDEKKAAAASESIRFVETGTIVGVGTGSTVNFFIHALAEIRDRIAGAVSSSEASTKRLRDHEIPVFDLAEIGRMDVYVDGADEANPQLQLIKGGGGALTREKIVAAAANKFVCIVDDTKLVPVLGTFPLPVEVIPMARALVSDQLVEMGGRPEWRDGFVTDNGNDILDVHGLRIDDPLKMETEINQLAGVVTVGLFARRPADVLVIASDSGVETTEAWSVNPVI